MILEKKGPLNGTITVPGDKSISHRAIMLGSLSEGDTIVHGFSSGADCHTTMKVFRSLGISIEEDGTDVRIHGKGLHGLTPSADTLDMGNSGTTTRLISGILAAQDFTSVLSGDASLNSRPMGRVMKPLSEMGACIESINGNGCAPLAISGTQLHGIHYDSPVASAQVKSCILLAGLYADRPTSVTEPYPSRDHTERMLPFFGAKLSVSGTTVTVMPCEKMTGGELTVPGDISTAAFYLTAALLVPKSHVTVKNVGINPTRSGLLTVLKRMGANLTMENIRNSGGEEMADLTAKTSTLHATDIMAPEVPALVDEIPILAIAAALAEGTSTFYGVNELRKKESDRLLAIEEGLSSMGVPVSTTEDTLTITGVKSLSGAKIHTFKDHRIAMSFAVAALTADTKTELDDTDCVAISCPVFFDLLQKLF